MDDRDVVLLTGFAGSLAGQLFEHLLLSEPEARFELLSHDLAAARSRLETLPAGARSRTTLIDGDQTAIDFGLSGVEYRELGRRITHLIHLIPALDVELGATELERRNVGSMREVLEFARNAGRLRAIVVQSSTAVAGDHSGLVLETELALGQDFRSPVERSLAIAERMARAEWERLPLVVARCSRIVGDSRTGRPHEAEPLWSLIEHVANAPAQFEVPMPAPSPARVHLVPSDVVVDALYRLLLERRAQQRCVQLTDPGAPTLRGFFELLADAAGRRRAAEHPHKRLARALGVGSGSRGRRLRQLLEELSQPVEYDRHHAEDLLPGLELPPFDAYVERLVGAARAAREPRGG